MDEDKIKEIIKNCAETCEVKDFEVESVKCLTKDPNPWSKSFKVSVPAKFEEAMKNPRMYLPTWEARPFTRWPSRQGHTDTQSLALSTQQQESLQVDAAAVSAAAEA